MLQRDIDATCEPVGDAARPYFDDIIIGTKRSPGMSDAELIEKHVQDVCRVFDRLELDKWVADKTKARLLMRRVEFCGHLLGGGKRVPAPGKLSAVQRWTPPPTVTALRAFLGLCNYYAAYVRMFAEYAAPLQEKLKLPRELGKAGSKHKLDWSTEELIAFERLKKALVADLELHHVDTTKPFVLKTDASQYAIGAALEQFPDIEGEPALEDVKPGASVPIGFLSRKLTPGQRDRWDTRDKETYAVVSGLERWAGYIGYNKVLVLTDHKSLESWYKEHVAGMGPTGRRARWHAKLNKFRLDVIHIPGSTNIVSDALSRWAYPACSGVDDVSWHGTASDTKTMKDAIVKEKETERSTPPAQHPLDEQTKEDELNKQMENMTVSTVTLGDGTPSTAFHMPDGRVLGLAWVTFKKTTEMDKTIAAVTRNQAKKDKRDEKEKEKENVDPEEHEKEKTHNTRARAAAQRAVPPEEEERPHEEGEAARPALRAAEQRGDEGVAAGEEEQHQRDRSDLLADDWAAEYRRCPVWSEPWQQVQEAQRSGRWPRGYRVAAGRMLKGGLWCVPTALAGAVLRAHHAAAGHVGGQRLWKEALRHFHFADNEKAYTMAMRTQAQCSTCQACEHPHQPLRLKVTPAPSRRM